jgi:hypothetical protein
VQAISSSTIDLKDKVDLSDYDISSTTRLSTNGMFMGELNDPFPTLSLLLLSFVRYQYL